MAKDDKLQKQNAQKKSMGRNLRGGKKRYYSPNKENGAQEAESKGFSSANDFKWYWQNANVAKAAANINYTNVAGLPLTIPFISQSDYGDYAGMELSGTIPGIMQINYAPTIGYSADLRSNVNVAARLVYSYVRHANSGSKVYESPDLMTYLLGVANAQAFQAYMERLYGLLNISSIMNRYIPDAIIEACGGDPDDLRSNMAQLRYYINTYAVQLNTFAVPKQFTYFDRLEFLPLHVFTDGDNSKSQLYVFKPEYFFKWSGTGSAGSELIPENLPIKAKLADLIAYGDELINALITNEDIGIMSGDILKAFGRENLRQLIACDEKYVTIPVKDEGMLAQIHNMTCIDYIDEDFANFKITQSGGHLICKPTFLQEQPTQAILRGSLFDTWLDDPTPEFTMEASRLVSYATPSEEDGKYEVDVCGTEIITSIKIDSQLILTQNAGGNGDYMYNNLTLLSRFDWHPYVYGNKTPHDGGLLMPFGDVQNYTVMTAANLQRIHNAALQSLFNVSNLYLSEV